MRQKISPAVAVILIIATIAVLGLVGMKVMDSSSHEQKVIVQPADPKQIQVDPKMKVENSGT